jgi:flavorubredoxin
MIPVTLDTVPYLIAPDTFLVPTFAAEPSGAYFGAHSLVIRGAEPVIVDTGCSLVREQWLAQTFSVVEPVDVRWVFLSHDDHDHIGNLDVVLEMCPNATLVCNFPIVARLMGDVELPLDRMRWVDPGQSLDVGDRTLQIVRPPMFDSPATRGLVDPTTGFFWAVDSFGTFFPGEIYEAGDIPTDLYESSFAALNGWNTPWLELVDAERFAAHVAKTSHLPLEVVASAHGPILRGAQIDDAFRRTLDLAGQPILPVPGQETLDLLVSSLFAASV